MNPVRLAIVSTHPIQYYAPQFRALARMPGLETKVFFTLSQSAQGPVMDTGFGRAVEWDIPLLEGYEHEFVPNVASPATTARFRGLRNPDLTPAIERWDPDAVLIFGWNSQSHLNALRTFKGWLPVLFRGDSTLLDDRPGWRRIARRFVLSWVYRHVDLAIAVGSNNRDYYRWCGVPDGRIAFAPHAVDTARFADASGASEARAAQWRAELGIRDDEPTVVFAGKLTSKKDPLLLLEAFRHCGVRGHLVFAGNGALEEELRRRAADRADVHFLPFQNQSAMPAVYRLGSVFALPSRGPGETWGLALNEAMACGRPVIASSKVGSARDLVKEGINGWTFESGDVAALTRVLREALSCDVCTLRQMGANARQESAKGSIEAAAEGIARAVWSVVGAADTRHVHA